MDHDAFVLIWSCSYLIYDTSMGIFKRYLSFELLLHHIVAVTLIVQAYWMNEETGVLLICFGFGELSNPFLNLMEAFEVNGAAKKYSAVSGLIFVVTFIFCRVFVFPYLVFYAYESEINTFFLTEICVNLILGLVWTWALINKLFKVLTELMPGNKKAAKGYEFVKLLRPYRALYIVVVSVIFIFPII
jgi:hypothetical protein